jgi:glyoxylate reductase
MYHFFSSLIDQGNTPGILTETTADLAVALILATARRIPEVVNSIF